MHGLAAFAVPLAAAALMFTDPGKPAAGGGVRADVAAAASYATSRGAAAGVAVLDTTDGKVWLAGEHSRTFSSASVVKVMIAARLLVTGRMRGDIATTARRMIARSDDDAANALYGLVGGDGLINWTKAHYGVPSLGHPPSPPGRWGNTRVTPRGIVALYAKLKADPAVAPWLLDAMRRSTPYGADGQFQHFGIPAATRDFALKQGWTCCDAGVATFASTGFVDQDRYAVVLFADGPPYTYGEHLTRTLNGMARALLRGGTIDRPAPPPAPAPTPLHQRCRFAD